MKENSLVIYRMSEPVPAPATTTNSTPAPVTAAEPAPAPTVAQKGGKQKSKKMGGKSRKSRKMSAGAKSWVSLVSQVYKQGKAKNPSYKFKQALKDASKMKKKNKTAKA
jgi:hypothetical protein